MTQVQVRIRMDEASDLEVAQDYAYDQPALEFEATTDAPSGGIEAQIEPVTAVLVAAGAATVVKFVMDWWEKRRGGLVLDMRPKAKDQIYRDADVPYGVVLIYPQDGSLVKVETHDMPKDGMQQLLEAVVSGAYKTVADLAKAAKKALPDASVKKVPSVTET
jgi:hypothetical protein